MVDRITFDVDESHDEIPNKRKWLNILIFIIILIPMGYAILKYGGTAITGNVAIDVNRVNLDEMAYKGSNYHMQANQSMPVKSARISGTVIGEGKVKVFLNVNDERRLVYTSEKKKALLTSITGLAVEELKKPGMGVLLDEAQVTSEGKNVLEGIRLSNDDYEMGFFIDKIRITSASGDSTKVKGIMINKNKFWGYGTAGMPLGDQPLGVLLDGWGARVNIDEIVPIDEILFDSNIENKYLQIEIFYREFMHGHNLGQERYVKIHLFLNGAYESYVEGDGKMVKKYSYKVKEDTTAGGSSGSKDDSEDKGTSGSEGTKQGDTEKKPIGKIELKDVSDYAGNDRYEKVTYTTEGKVLKERKVEDLEFSKDDQVEMEIKITEDPKMKEAFEQADNTKIRQIVAECDETCDLGFLSSDNVDLEFEMDEGTGINVTAVDFG